MRSKWASGGLPRLRCTQATQSPPAVALRLLAVRAGLTPWPTLVGGSSCRAHPGLSQERLGENHQPPATQARRVVVRTEVQENRRIARHTTLLVNGPAAEATLQQISASRNPCNCMAGAAANIHDALKVGRRRWDLSFQAGARRNHNPSLVSIVQKWHSRGDGPAP